MKRRSRVIQAGAQGDMRGEDAPLRIMPDPRSALRYASLAGDDA